MIRVRDLMHRGLVVCAGSTTLGELAAQLVKASVHALVVVDDTGRPAGVVTDTDLLAGEWLAADAKALEALKRVRADELMSVPPDTIDADDPIEAAVDRLASRRIGRLLVAEGGEAVGVLAVSDVIRYLGRQEVVERRSVGDVMTHGMVVCRPETPVVACARLMTERHSRSVLVVERDGRAVGVVTGLDVLPAALGEAGTIERFMRPPLTVTPDVTLRAAADLMLAHETNRLVVVEAGSPAPLPLGLVSSMDIVAEMAAPRSVWREAGGAVAPAS